jgi:hypothetical protein
MQAQVVTLHMTQWQLRDLQCRVRAISLSLTAAFRQTTSVVSVLLTVFGASSSASVPSVITSIRSLTCSTSMPPSGIDSSAGRSRMEVVSFVVEVCGGGGV